MEVDALVLGGGWAGATLALELKHKYPSLSVAVLEQETRSGGLLRSEVIDGHVFDTGGSHVIFSRDGGILNRMLSLLEGNVVEHSRRSFVSLGPWMVPYPIENGLYALPPEERAEALISFLEAFMSLGDGWRPKNLMEWIRGFFGRWFAEKYLEPYNRKIWKRPLEEIDVDWVYTPGRLPVPDWRDVARSAAGVPTVGYREQARFYYPLEGGIERLHSAVVERATAEGVVFRSGVKVSNVKMLDDGWVVNGEFVSKRIYSTIPLVELVKAMDAPEEIMRAAAKLDFNQVLVVGVAIKGEAPQQHWVYVPDSRYLFHRYAWISNYSQLNSPSHEGSLIAEVTVPPSEAVDAAAMGERVVDQLIELDVLDERNILFWRAWLHNYGYPIHTLERASSLALVRGWLMDQEVTSVGRWGGWKYLNMDGVYAEVLKAFGDEH